jgi:hypothetical protein
MPRPQFSIRTLLWLTLCIACFLGGIEYGKHLQRRWHHEEFVRIVKQLEVRGG